MTPDELAALLREMQKLKLDVRRLTTQVERLQGRVFVDDVVVDCLKCELTRLERENDRLRAQLAVVSSAHVPAKNLGSSQATDEKPVPCTVSGEPLGTAAALVSGSGDDGAANG